MNNNEVLRAVDEFKLTKDSEILVNALQKSKNHEIQVKLLKLMGSLRDKEKAHIYDDFVINSKSEKVRREAMSCLGRLRSIDIVKNTIIKHRYDKNPEIVLQTIRAMLPFKDDPEIKKIIEDIYKTNNNEMINNVLSIEMKTLTLDKDTPKSHIEVDENYKNKVVNVDTLEYLRQMKDNSIHLTFTSPPYYNARDYSTYGSYKEYIDFLEDVFKEIHRVTKDGRFLIINTSPVLIPRAGRKYSSKRYPIAFDLHKCLSENGWDFIDDIIWKKPDPSVKNRIGGFIQHRKPLMYKPNAITENIVVYRKKSNRLIDWSIRAYPQEIIERSRVEDFPKNNVWEIAPKHDKVHSAVFPYKLCENIVKLYSFEGDLVFDPFAGSGTLGKAALDLNRNILLTELSEEYFNYIQNNLGLHSQNLTFERMI